MDNSDYYNQQIEQTVLGSILLDNKNYYRISGKLRADHFLSGLHRDLYAIIEDYLSKGSYVDPVLLSPLFKDHPAFSENITANAYFASLIGCAVSIAISDYADLIIENSQRFQLACEAKNIHEATKNHQIPVKEQIEYAEKAIFRIGSNKAEDRILSLGDSTDAYLHEALEQLKSSSTMTGISSGFKGIDEKLSGLNEDHLIVLAGRPAMGKTALGTKIAFNVARSGFPVLFFSLEMSSKELSRRLLLDEASITKYEMDKKLVSDEKIQDFINKQMEIARYPLWIDDTPRISLQALCSKARAMKATKKIGLIVIDYIQIVQSKGDNPVQQITEITNTLKALAKELHIPIIGIAQLNRATETREDKRPQLADLKNSGSIEQDADSVLFCYREEYYLNMKEPAEDSKDYFQWQEKLNKAKDKAEIIIAKNRHGETGSILMQFKAKYTRFHDL